MADVLFIIACLLPFGNWYKKISLKYSWRGESGALKHFLMILFLHFSESLEEHFSEFLEEHQSVMNSRNLDPPN